MAATVHTKKIAVFCSPGNIYHNNDNKSSIMKYQSCEVLSKRLVGFLSRHGFNAAYGFPHGVSLPQIGSTTGGLIAAVSTGAKIILNAKKVADLVQQWLEDKAYAMRKQFLPNIVVRLEIAEQEGDWRTSDFTTADDLRDVQQLTSTIQEVSNFLSREYPMFRFEYIIIAPRANQSCFSIYIPDSLITNVNIMKVIKTLPKTRVCTLKLEKLFGFIPFAIVSTRNTTHIRKLYAPNVHHHNCGQMIPARPLQTEAVG